MLSVRNNAGALFALRSMHTHQNTMQRAMKRLSSGYRINSAADDAAGLAISERMRSQIRGLQMASRNAQQSISLMQTAEGALQETHNMLQRMRELCVQAANGTLSEHDRALLDLEYQELKKAINGISDSTHYNGIKLLNGTFGGKEGVDELNRIGLDPLDITITGNVNGEGKLLIKQLADGRYNVTLQLDNSSYTVTVDSTSTRALFDDMALGIPGAEISFGITSFADLREGAVAGFRFRGGVVDTRDIKSAHSGDTAVFQIGANGGLDQRMGSRIGDMSSNSLGNNANGVYLKDTNILTVDNANAALKVVEDAVKQVSYQRAAIGAQINRLEHTINSLENSIENLTAAESAIRDADMAEEMMNYTKASILMQAAQAMFAQALQQPNTILQLLKSL